VDVVYDPDLTLNEKRAILEASNRYRRVTRKRRLFSRGSGPSGHSQPLQ